MNVAASLFAVVLLLLVGMYGGGAALPYLFGVALPYLAVIAFLGGMIWRILGWAKVPVPFRIPTTCGQQKTLPWIKDSKIENPSDGPGVVLRMLLEVLFFRSLLRNTKAELNEGGKVAYATSLGLWLGALAFHWTMLTIVVRHMRFFLNPVPAALTFLEDVDGFLEIGVPVFYATTGIFLASLAYLLLRRLASPQLRYLSLPSDYFPLFLLLGIGISGFLLRHLEKTDLRAVKELAVGLVTFSPVVPPEISPLFFGHLFLVCVLLAYLPFSKLSHLAGVFLSPTRNMANNNRAVRHVNPWDYPVKTHPYHEYEDEFREKMKKAGIPVDKE